MPMLPPAPLRMAVLIPTSRPCASSPALPIALPNTIASRVRGNAITRKAVLLAIEEGHLRKDTDAEQIAFELLGIVLASHNHRRLLGDKEARKRALKAFEELSSRHSVPQKLQASR